LEEKEEEGYLFIITLNPRYYPSASL